MTTKVTVKEEAKQAIAWNLIYTHHFGESGDAGRGNSSFVKYEWRCIYATNSTIHASTKVDDKVNKAPAIRANADWLNR